jgi:hypothetical protein
MKSIQVVNYSDKSFLVTGSDDDMEKLKSKVKGISNKKGFFVAKSQTAVIKKVLKHVDFDSLDDYVAEEVPTTVERMILIKGSATKEHKDALTELGGLWVNKLNGWVLPHSAKKQALALID